MFLKVAGQRLIFGSTKAYNGADELMDNIGIAQEVFRSTI
jgi:hypothetical protein